MWRKRVLLGLGVVVALGVFILGTILYINRSYITIGNGYVLVGVGSKGIVQLADRQALADVLAAARKVRYVTPFIVLDVTSTRDSSVEYQINLPSPDAPHGPISGCKQPVSYLFGSIQLVPAWMSYPAIAKVSGDLAPQRASGILTSCVVYGLASGDVNIYAEVSAAVAPAVTGKQIFEANP